ncbi:MAG: hypothetical protein ACRC33_14540, partial [Gemmataceae bacterium]
IRDGAGLFSPAAVREASERIAGLKAKYGQEIHVETVPSQPSMADIEGILYKGSRDTRLRIWVRERAAASGLDKGLFVVVSKSPPDVRLAGWPTEAEERFLWSRREEVRSGMRRYLRDSPDRALSEAVDRFAALLEQTRQAPSPFATIGMLTVMGGVVGVWLVLCVVRRRVLGLTAVMYPPPVQGGLFGTPSASWIYDRLFRGEKGATGA